MRIAISLLLIALVGASAATTVLVLFGTTGVGGLCLHYGALRHADSCKAPPEAVWKTVAVLAPAALGYILVSPRSWPMWPVLWFWPALFWIGAVRLVALGLDNPAGISSLHLAGAALCVAAGAIPIVGWRWSRLPSEDPPEAREVLHGFLLAGVGVIGVFAGLVYTSIVA